MSDPIGPGDWVECLSVAPKPNSSQMNLRDLRLLTLGAVYVVAGFGVSTRGPIGVLLKGFPPMPKSGGYDPSRFRPVHRPGKSTLIRDLLQPVKEDA